ncbi:MAG: hypothetical protein WCO79_02055 [bacterium]
MIRTGKYEAAGFGSLLIAGSLVSVHALFPVFSATISAKLTALNLAGAHAAVTETLPTKTPFQVPFALEASAAYVIDTVTGEVLFSRNGTTSLPLASVTKLMTALTAYEQLPPSTVAVIRSSDIVQEGDSGLLANEHWRLKDLLDFTLLVSSNDGASALASASMAFSTSSQDADIQKREFVTLMNQKAQKLGLTSTYFSNESGLDISSTTAGAYGSAKDMTTLFSYILDNHPEMIEATRYEKVSFTSIDDFRHPAKNTNEAVNAIPGLIGSKTGLTDLAGGNLVVAMDIGFQHPVIIAVLGSSEEGRFSDTEALASSTLAYFRQ